MPTNTHGSTNQSTSVPPPPFNKLVDFYERIARGVDENMTPENCDEMLEKINARFDKLGNVEQNVRYMALDQVNKRYPPN